MRERLADARPLWLAIRVVLLVNLAEGRRFAFEATVVQEMQLAARQDATDPDATRRAA